MEASPERTLQKKETSPKLQELEEKLSSLPAPEEKIALGLQFMREAISQEGSPNFREFWEARRTLFELFKSPMGAAIRSRLWKEYTELTAEARRLKEIFEEQASFATEQIDLAIQALEHDVSNFVTLLSQAKDLHFPESSPTLIQKAATYNQLQRELNLLNTLATRLNGLRKEIFQTELRIRQKTKFLKRLADLSEPIFPRRKELIDQVSAEFEKDVQSFIDAHFREGGAFGAPFYALREEIKTLQGMAKTFTLNSDTFTKTRLKLSECWDLIKAGEAERKQEVMQKRQVSSENTQTLQKQIDDLAQQAASLSLRDLDQKIQEISQTMRNTDLQREDVRLLREALTALRAPHVAASEQKMREREEAEKEKLRQRREQLSSLKEQIDQLMKSPESAEVSLLVQTFEELTRQVAALELSKIEKQPLDRQLRSLKDFISERKEKALLNLSEDQLQAIGQLQVVLHQKKERRKEIKDQLEIYRKAISSSGLDFEKAMTTRELFDQERERLEKINAGIEEIEQKISELEHG